MARLFIVLSALTLVSCGFTPMYASSHGAGGTDVYNQTTATTQKIYVEPIPERTGQILRNELLDAGFSDDPTGGPVLRVVISEGLANLGVASDSTATRNQLTLSAYVTLNKDGKDILNRTLIARATYNVLLSQYTTLVSQSAARDEAIQDLTRQIQLQATLALKGAP